MNSNAEFLKKLFISFKTFWNLSIKSEKSLTEFKNFFFGLNASSTASGNADAINSAFKKNIFQKDEFIKPEFLTQPSEQTIEAINKIFKNKNIKTISEKVFSKIKKDARLTQLSVEQKVRKNLLKILETGKTKSQAKNELIAQGFPQNYAEVVFRTNLNNSYNAGKYDRAMKTDYIDGFRYVSNTDNRTRKNHEACNGLEQPKDSPWWDYLYPPLGYNCRCTVVMILAGTLKKKVPSGLVFPPLKRTGSKGFSDF